MNPVEMIPISKIHVLNPRSRGKGKFRVITDSVLNAGLKCPPTVSRRKEDDEYDLVCGEGRLKIYIDAGATEIPAIVDDMPLEDRLLRSLAENLTRRTRTAFEMARDLPAMKKRGHSNADIAAMIGLSEKYVSQLIRLMEKGEERLVNAVERGEIPITVAIEIATSDDATLQRSLTEAYESGQLRGRPLLRVRKLIEQRRARGKELSRSGGKRTKPASTHDLLRALRKETQRQELLVKKSRHCEQQLRFVVSALKDLRKNEDFLALLRTEKLDAVPKCLSDRIPMTTQPISPAFEFDVIMVPLDQLSCTEPVSERVKASTAYQTLLASIRTVGIAEPLRVFPLGGGKYRILDGRARAEVLRDLGTTEAPCLKSLKDEEYSHNTKVNRIAPIQATRMMIKALDSGASEEESLQLP